MLRKASKRAAAGVQLAVRQGFCCGLTQVDRGRAGCQEVGELFRGLIGGAHALVQEEVAGDVDVVVPVTGLGHQGGAPTVPERHLSHPMLL